MTLGVIKNIIPAIASTNAILSGKKSNLLSLVAACALEAFKLVTRASNYLNNYMMYNGLDGVYTYSFELEKKADCYVCGSITKKIAVDPTWTFQHFIDDFIECKRDSTFIG